MKKKFKEKHKKDFLLLYLGFSMFFVFLFLWFITLPSVDEVKVIDEQPPERRFDELSAAEQLEYVEEQEQKAEDEVYYNLAIRTNNNAYCERIKDLDLRSSCFEEITISEEIFVDNRSTSDAMDDSNFALARRLGDISYCERIDNINTKESCLEHFNS